MVGDEEFGGKDGKESSVGKGRVGVEVFMVLGGECDGWNWGERGGELEGGRIGV